MKLGANRNARIHAILVMVLILFTGCSGLRTDAEVNQSVGSISERPLQNDLEEGVILAIKPTSYLIEPEEYFDERLFDITLDSGIYEISCEQDITLSYVDRNRFCFVCGDDTTYEATDNLFAGKHSWVITVLEKDRYAFNAWVVSPSEKVKLSNFTIMRKGDVPHGVPDVKPEAETRSGAGPDALKNLSFCARGCILPACGLKPASGLNHLRGRFKSSI